MLKQYTLEAHFHTSRHFDCKQTMTKELLTSLMDKTLAFLQGHALLYKKSVGDDTERGTRMTQCIKCTPLIQSKGKWKVKPEIWAKNGVNVKR